MEYTIIENGEEITLTQSQFEKISDIVYYCDECKFYHIKQGLDMDVLESRVKDSN